MLKSDLIFFFFFQLTKLTLQIESHNKGDPVWIKSICRRNTLRSILIILLGLSTKELFLCANQWKVLFFSLTNHVTYMTSFKLRHLRKKTYSNQKMQNRDLYWAISTSHWLFKFFVKIILEGDFYLFFLNCMLSNLEMSC